MKKLTGLESCASVGAVAELYVPLPGDFLGTGVQETEEITFMFRKPSFSSG